MLKNQSMTTTIPRPTQILINPIRNRVLKHNKKCHILVVGEPGSGKSWLSLSMSIMIDPRFKRMFKTNIVFSFNEYLRVLRATTKTGAYYLKKAMVLIHDELGTQDGGYKRQWYSNVNQSYNNIFQTQRYRNLVTFDTVPFESEVDSSFLKYFDYLIETVRIHPDINCTEVKVFKLFHNRQGITFKQYLRYNGVIYKTFLIPRPPAWLTDYYENKKKEYNDGLTKRLSDKINLKNKKIKRVPHNVEELAKKVLLNPKEYVNEKGKFTISSLRIGLKIKDTVAQALNFYLKRNLNPSGIPLYTNKEVQKETSSQ